MFGLERRNLSSGDPVDPERVDGKLAFRQSCAATVLSLDINRTFDRGSLPSFFSFVSVQKFLMRHGKLL